MASIIEGLIKSFTATVTVDQYSVVALDGGKVAPATVTTGQTVVGTALAAADKDDIARIQLANAGGTTFGICAVTVSQGVEVYAAAGGKVSTVTTNAGDAYGVALEEGVPDQVIEILLA